MKVRGSRDKVPRADRSVDVSWFARSGRCSNGQKSTDLLADEIVTE